MKIENDELIFSTGKTAYANKGIIGLSPDLDLTYGYDGDFSSDKLTDEEKLELANYMLVQWETFRLSLPTKIRGYR